MTAIVSNTVSESPPVTRIGLAVPGLGHLAVGEWRMGLGIMSQLALLVVSAAAGLPRIVDIVTVSDLSYKLHGFVSLVAWLVIAGILWWAAYRRAYPRQMSHEEYHSNRQIMLRTLAAHKTGMIGFFGVIFMISIVILTPLLATYNPTAIDVGPALSSPNWTYLMGTDEFGRDVYSRMLWGGRISLSIGFIAVAISATIGTTLGAASAYFGGNVDRGIMFLVDMLLSFPKLILLLTIVGLFRVQGTKGIFLIVFILGATAWMGIARIVRAQVLSLKQQEFIQAARALGLSNPRILFRHLIPNALAPVIVYSSLAIGGTMLAEAGLSFLGIGVPPPTATWGVMINDGRDVLTSAWWIAFFPGVAIVISVLCFNLVGDGLRDALDPKLR